MGLIFQYLPIERLNLFLLQQKDLKKAEEVIHLYDVVKIAKYI